MKTKFSNKQKGNLLFKFTLISITLTVVIFAIFLFSTNLGFNHRGKAKVAERALNKRQLSFSTRNLQDVSASFQDTRPLISQDGKTLFFGRRNYMENIGGEIDFQDIWVATQDSLGNFSNASSLGDIINNNKANGICSVSPDGNEIIITNEYTEDKFAPISRAKKVNGKWSHPIPVFVENYYNKNKYVDFYLSYENDILLMAVERKGGQGDQDIYLSLPDGKGNWLTPISLGPGINTVNSDFAPYLSSDGKTLFFSSNREGGLGESDIYMATRLDSTWTNWSNPKNLGPSVNSVNEETYFSISSDLKSIYIESFEIGKTNREIYQMPLPSLNSNYLENSMVSSN